MIKNNWLSFPDKNELIVVDESYQDVLVCNTLSGALRRNAKAIHDDYPNLCVLLSGGVDSHAMSIGFRHIPCKHIFIRFTFEDGSSNSLEEFFAVNYAKRNRIKLDILEYHITYKHFIELLESKNFFSTETGLGALIQLNAYDKVREKYPNHELVVGTPLMCFERENNKCRGVIPSPYRGLAQGYDPEKYILFYYYSPYVFRYYQHIHETKPEIQVFKKYQPKNLAFTELGLPFRPKMNGWESLTNVDFQNLTTIDFGNDHNIYNYIATKIFKNETKLTPTLWSALIKSKPRFNKMNILYEFEIEKYSWEENVNTIQSRRTEVP